MSDTSQQKLSSLIDKFDSAMLVTVAADGELRSRPMAIAEHTDDEEILFITSATSPKIDEVVEEPHVNVAFQGSDTYLSISGTAKLVRDRDTIDKAWSPAMKPWFPDGKETSDLVVLKVVPKTGEYWNMKTRDKLRFLVKAGKALIQDESLANKDYGEHGTVRM